MKSVLKVVGVILLVSVILPVLFYVGLKIWGDWHDEWSGYNYSQYISDGVCNIAVIPVTGNLVTISDPASENEEESLSTSMSDTVSLISKAEQDPNIFGTLLFVDSGGGSAAAGEFIAAELMKSAMPTAAYILDVGASAAYLAATGADTIIASPFADVGSIGVTMSYLDYSKQNAKEGIEYVSLTSGKFKDYGSPDKSLTAEERILLERDLAIWHEEFVKQVATNRNLSIEEVVKLADGSSMPGKMALENKLIDQLGNKETVREWFAKQLVLKVEDVVFCQ